MRTKWILQHGRCRGPVSSSPSFWSRAPVSVAVLKCSGSGPPRSPGHHRCSRPSPSGCYRAQPGCTDSGVLPGPSGTFMHSLTMTSVQVPIFFWLESSVRRAARCRRRRSHAARCTGRADSAHPWPPTPSARTGCRPGTRTTGRSTVHSGAVVTRTAPRWPAPRRTTWR